MAVAVTGCVKLGHPLPESYLSPEANRGAPHATHA
jgi:hypothetical protein